MMNGNAGVESENASAKVATLGFSAVFITYFLTSFMTLGLSIASPMIAADLNGMALFSWAISLPALAMSFVALLFGRLSDIYGRRNLLLTSLFFFTIGSVLGAVSWSFVINIVARIVNALGLGAMSALCFAVVGDLYADPAARSKWTGLLNIAGGISATCTQILVGIITDTLSWRYFFWVNVPVAIFCIIMVTVGVPKKKVASGNKIDYTGALLLALASSAVILGFSFADKYPWVSFHVLGLLIISIILWYLFILAERRTAEPILDPLVFTNRAFLTAAAAVLLSFFGFIGILNYFPLFLQGIQGTGAKISGLVLTPFSMLLAFMGVPAGLLIAKTKRYKWIYILSYAVVTIAMFALAFFNSETPLWMGVAVMILSGFGIGAIPTVNILVVQFAVPKRFMGISVAAIFFIANIGTAVAPAIMGPAMNATYEKRLAELLPQDLETKIGSDAFKKFSDPGVLMSKDSMAGFKAAFSKAQGLDHELFENTIQSVRGALQSGLRVVFLIGSIAILLAFLIIITIPEVPLNNGGEGSES